MIDVPADIHGIDLGPAPTALPAGRGARRRGARRRAVLVPHQRRDAGQPRADPRARPARRAAWSCSATRTRASSTASCSRAACPTYVAPEYEHELGMAHGVTPAAAEEALAPAPGARAAFIVSPTYYGMAADIAGCAAVCHARGVPLVVDQAWGPHFGFHPDLPPSALHAGRRRRAHLDAQDRRLAHAVGDAARRADAGGSTRGRSRAWCGSRARTSPSALLHGLARRRAAPARRPRPGAAGAHDGGGRRRARGDRRRRRACAWSATSSSAARAWRAGTRCGS